MMKNLPSGISEAAFIAIVDNIGNKLCYKYRFGYFSTEDIKQEVWYICIKVLDKYDGVRKLDNFLYKSAENRLKNLKRDRTHRTLPPCKQCPLWNSGKQQCSIYNERLDCPAYAKWAGREKVCNSLMSPSNIEHASEYSYSNDHTNDIANKELLVLIEKYLSDDLKAHLDKLKAGEEISHIDRDNLLKAVADIFWSDYDTADDE